MTAYLLEDIWHMFWGNWSRRRNAEVLNSRVLKVEMTESLSEIDLVLQSLSTMLSIRLLTISKHDPPISEVGCYHGKFEICKNCRKQG